MAHETPVGAGGGGGIDDAATGLPVTLGRRFSALLIDWMLCLLASAPFGGLQDNSWVAPATLLVEYTFFIGLFRQTPGMYVARIACVAYADGGPIGIPRAMLRGLLLILFVPALIMNREQRGLHDRAAGSVIVGVSGRAST